MNYYGAKNMADSWRTVRSNTVLIAEEIPAEQYGFRAAPDTMTVGEMLAHMAANTHWAVQAHFVDKKDALSGPDFGRYFGEAKALSSTLTTKDAIVHALKVHGEDIAARLEASTDAFLAETVTLPFGSKSRFEMLLGLKEHEMHHRGQLMLLQRMLGMVPHLTRAMQQRAAAAAASATAA